ncbi:DNA binding domain-containing protein, excisionase family [Parapedobacter composti]|uniref:DNA binding domain-containing protein, excisionase family n=2 Tax=Parapedobacter composti TaxID=623281 RepID=A0A1I1GEQ0_9SPHI|nr:DNA binding domain-containing protein, excisionase family [Parapedobacter composti]
MLLSELTNEIKELKAIVENKLTTTPEGYEPDTTMDVQEAAEYLRCTPDNVYKKVRSGSLPHYRNGKLILFKKKELDEAIKVKPYKRKFFK